MCSMILILQYYHTSMVKKEVNQIDNNEAIKNLLIINLLKEGVHPKMIAQATGLAEKTIRNNFPMKLIRKNE